MVFAVVPIKSFGSAKTRLGSKLDGRQRAALARASAVMVLRAVAHCPAVQRRLAVVEDEEIAQLARRHGFDTLVRPDLTNQSAAVEAGFDHARAEGAESLLTISADVPLAQPRDLEQMMAPPGPVLVLVSNLRGEGTNALRLSPAQAMRLHFGPGSLQQHQREAALMGVRVKVIDNPRLRLDLDTPDDLDVLEKSGPAGRRVLVDAGRLVREVQLEEQWAAQPGPG